MKANIEFFGLPNLTKAIGAKRIQLEVSQGTPKNILANLTKKFGKPVKDTLFDNKGNLDHAIQILRNGKEWITHDKLNTKLKDGDTITFMMMVAGG